MARRVSLALAGALCALLALGGAWVLSREERPLTPAAAPLSPASAPGAPDAPPTLLDAAPPPPVDARATSGDGDPGATEPDSAEPDASPAAPAPAPSPEALTRGRVVDPKGRPIGGAELTPVPRPGARRRRRWSARSGHDGSFTLPGLPPSGLIAVRAGGYVSREVPLAKPRARLTIVLRGARRHLGTVVAADDLSLLRGVRLVAQATNWKATTHTDPLGRFSLEPPAEETFWILASKRFFVAKVWREEDHPTIELSRGRPVTGKLLRKTDQGLVPAAQAMVFFVGATQRASPPHRIRAETDGTFRLKGGIDPKEEFAVLAADHRYATPLEPTWFPAGKDGLLVVLEERGGVVLRNGPRRGRLRPVAAEGLGVPLNYASARAARGGTLQWSRLAPGSYQFAHDDGTRVGRPFEVRAGKTTYVRWKDRGAPGGGAKRGAPRGERERAPPARAQEVRVLDTRGKPLQGAKVTAQQAETVRRATTDARGRARLRLGPGRWTLRATRPGLHLERALERDPARSLPATLRLVPPSTLRGRLQPPGAAELALRDGAGEVIARARSSADGAFALPELRPGSFRLEITQGKTTSVVEVEVPGPELVIQLEE